MEKLLSGALELGINLSLEQLEKFEIYYRELTDWNSRMNLTSITDYEEVQLKHFLDSLTAVPFINPLAAGRTSVIDVGTGGGLPGIPLKIATPGLRLVLLEATAKKADFLLHLITVLGLENVDILVGRAEATARDSGYRENFDLVISRAVASLPTLAELTLPFCAIGGSLVAWKKGDINGELEGALKAVSVLGGSLREVRAIELEELDDGRSLVIIDKVSQTPPEYPRRPGIPNKRPLA